MNENRENERLYERNVHAIRNERVLNGYSYNNMGNVDFRVQTSEHYTSDLFT